MDTYTKAGSRGCILATAKGFLLLLLCLCPLWYDLVLQCRRLREQATRAAMLPTAYHNPMRKTESQSAMTAHLVTLWCRLIRIRCCSHQQASRMT